jgi:hypothetical protein
MNLELATVEDATSTGCRVQYLDSSTSADARYSARVQAAGVVVRPCHLVVVDRSVDPPEVVYRSHTIAVVQRLDGESAVLNDGQRPPRTWRLIDRRPGEDQQAPFRVGDTVLVEEQQASIWPGDTEVVRPNRSEGVAEVLDTVVDGRPAHPERLRAVTFPVVVEIYGEEATKDE